MRTLAVSLRSISSHGPIRLTANAIHLPHFDGSGTGVLVARLLPAIEAYRAKIMRAASALRDWLVGSRRSTAVRRVNVPASSVMPADAQWIRVSGIVERSIRRGQTAVELHAAAALRIDSTEYEIRLLKHDLARVLGQGGARA